MPVAMGNNHAAQIHAEQSLADCVSSHYNTDGLTGGMRYSLAGGYQANSENVAGSDYCKTPAFGYPRLTSISTEVHYAMEVWMESKGHRETILKPRHRKVNIGLAWDNYNFRAVQQFEADYIEYTQLPQIFNGIFSMAGNLKNGANLEHGDHTRVILFYYPPPQQLTRGQIARVYGVCLGYKVAHLSYKSDGEVQTTWNVCITPDTYPSDSPSPDSAYDARKAWEEGKAIWEATNTKVDIVSQRIKMSRFDPDTSNFVVEANIEPVLSRHGPGVYEVVVWGIAEREVVILSEYMIFHETPRPTKYD